MGVTTIAALGDSGVLGTGPAGSSHAISQGGQGSHYELALELLANLAGVGPLLTSGIKGVWLSEAAGDASWSFTSGGNAWTDVATTDAFDKCLSKGKYGNGVNKVGTYTHPTEYRAAVGFDIEYADYAAGGDWQWRKNAGAYTNMGQTLAGDGQAAKFYVNTALAPGDTLDFRCYNGTSDCGCCLFGVRPWYVAPSATQGLIYDLWAVNGVSLHSFLTSTAGDRLDIIDSVKLGTGSPRANTPDVVTVQDLNDAFRADTTEQNVDLTALDTRFGLDGIVSTWEISPGSLSAVTQANWRAQNVTSATALGAALCDIYSQWAALGFTANAGAITAGFMDSDAVHLSQEGHLDTAKRLYWFFRNLLGIGNVPSSYPVSAKQAAVQYAGKLAAVQYAAGAPVSV